MSLRHRLRRTVFGLAVPAFLVATTARAAEYEILIDIDDEDDLVELNTAGDISTETFDTLVELLRRGVNLNTATREELFTLPNLTYAHVDAILHYRRDIGAISDPAMLVKAGVLEADTLRSIAAFIYIATSNRRYIAASGRVRLRSATSIGDPRVPASVLDGQVKTLRHLHLGFAGVLLRNRVSDVRYDPGRNALSAAEPRPQAVLPKFYANWDTDTYTILAGTYRAGFGQRLTFDNTRNYTPNGVYRDLTIYPRRVRLSRLCTESSGELDESPCAGDLAQQYGTPDFRWQQTHQGLAVGLKKLKVGPGWLQIYGMMSLQSKFIYQYQTYDPAVCDDPRNDDDIRCNSPDVYKRQPDLLAPTARYSYQSLPNMFRDTTAGGNISYFFNRRSWVGVTGYGTDITWQTGDRPLDFQEWAPQPFGGPFGAVGVNAAWGKRWSDLGVEISRSFDSMAKASGGSATEPQGGGGFAALLRHTAAWKRHEIETVIRYYDRNYANPYARPIAGSDVYEGLRARDEAGFRIRYTGKPTKKTNVRGFVNFWVSPTTKIPLIHVSARVQHAVTRWWSPSVWVEARDRDLRANGHGQCYGVVVGDFEGAQEAAEEPTTDYSNVYTEGGTRCGGENIRLIFQSTFTPHRRVTLTPRYQHRFIGDPRSVSVVDVETEAMYPRPPKLPRGAFRQDVSAWFTIVTRPVDPLRIRGRVRYLYMDIQDNTYLEQSLWTYLDAAYLIRKHFLVQVRYDVVAWLDQRQSSLDRSPSPEHRFMVTLEGRF